MKRARLTLAPALALVALVALGATASVRADDLPSEIVARPATLPHRMIALTLAGGYDDVSARWALFRLLVGDELFQKAWPHAPLLAP